ncbi:MAG: hypothetical protein FWG02_11210, partial [Holophagaceae bacterium]|nr:hypothetical protein [Holophagaceae bacterium]
TYQPQPPYIPDMNSVAISQTMPAPPAHAYVRPGPLPNELPARRIAPWPRASVLIDGTQHTKDLVVAVPSHYPATGRGNFIALMDATGTGGQFLARWPKENESPFGNSGYEIVSRIPEVDFATNLTAVPVKNSASGETSWFVIDFHDPENPVVVHREDGLSSNGGLANGVLYGFRGSQLVAIEVIKITSQHYLPGCNLSPRITVDLVTINQGVERHLGYTNIDPVLRDADRYTENPEAMQNDFGWKNDVPRVGGRPTIFRVYASKVSGDAIPPVSVKLEITGPLAKKKESDPEPESKIFLANENAQELTTEKGVFGKVKPGDEGIFTVFTFELTDKDDFSLLGPDTKLRLIVEPESSNESGNGISELEIYNPFRMETSIPFTYSEPMVIDLIPVDWKIDDPEVGPPQPEVALSYGELTAYKYELEEHIRAIMPITINDGTEKQYLTVHALIPDSSGKYYPNNITNGNKAFDRLVVSSDVLLDESRDENDELSQERSLYPFSDSDALFNYLYRKLCYSSKPYNANHNENRKIFKLLLLKAESEKTYNPDRTYGLIKGYGATGDHFSIVFADPAGSFNGESHMYTALHELGHNLGSTHAPVSIPPTEFNVDKHWYEKMHLDFQDSPYFQGKIGVPGHLFYLDDSNAGANIRVSWRNEYNRTLNKNSNDIMGYNNIESLIWISDRNFAQWYQHLNSSKAVTKRDFQAVKQLPE